MKSNCKEVRAKIKEHIIDTYPEFNDFKINADNAYWGRYPTTYNKVYEMVQGGCFLCYYHQVIEFIKTLNLNNSEAKYDAEDTWRLYCHLIAREGAKILEKGSY